MASTHDQPFDPSRPALVLLYGNTNTAHRYLDRDVVLVGRARGCDLGLEASDISSIHCLIVRGPGGFQLRDCQSRAGTKLNGTAVRENLLRDGDLLQVGPFSFRVHLPPGCTAGPIVPSGSRLRHLDRSRRNLARFALRQRKLLRLVRACQKPVPDIDADESLQQKASALKLRVRDYDRRSRIMEDSERELAADRETLDREMTAFRALVEQTQRDLAERRKAAEDEIAEKLRECEEKSRQQPVEQQPPAPPPEAILVVDQAAEAELAAERAAVEADLAAERAELEDRNLQFDRLKAELARRARGVELQREKLEQQAILLREKKEQLQQRAAEVDEREKALRAQIEQHQRGIAHLSNQLENDQQPAATDPEKAAELRQRLEFLENENASYKQALAQKLLVLDREQKELAIMRDQWVNDQAAILERLARQKSAMAQVEETLREQRRSLDDVLTALQQPRPEGDAPDAKELELLREENERLRQMAPHDSPGQLTAAELAVLLKENEELHHMLAVLESEREQAALGQAASAGLASTNSEAAAAEAELLRKLLKEKEDLIAELQVESAKDIGDGDPETFEAELNKFRRQLEADRKKLAQDIEAVRIRNEELDEETRESELAMSRERAELARERQRLERLREEVRLELERIQRDAGMRDRLVPVQNLRDEINSRRTPGNDQTPKPGKEDPLAARLRGLRNRMMDS
jgi:DNA repair exonuclease SbcCD ATPase subunit